MDDKIKVGTSFLIKLFKTLKNKDITTLDELIIQQYGDLGTEKRDAFEKGYQSFKLGALIQETRLKKGLTQEQLAEKVGMNKSYISTLQKVIEGLGGQLNLSISA